MAFGNPNNMTRDAFRWIYMKLGMYRIFAPTDSTMSAAITKLKGRAKKRGASQEWERRRSGEMAKDAEDRRAATRRGAVIDHGQASETAPPETPVKARHPHHNHAPQTGMLAVYQKMNDISGKRRTTLGEMV